MALQPAQLGLVRPHSKTEGSQSFTGRLCLNSPVPKENRYSPVMKLVLTATQFLNIKEGLQVPKLKMHSLGISLTAMGEYWLQATTVAFSVHKHGYGGGVCEWLFPLLD